MSVSAAADRLAAILDATPARFAAISARCRRPRLRPRPLAPKEILGHLIDSAGNNHQRFVRGQIFPSVADPSYDQENWVAAQHYIDEPWPDLVQLWTALNRHLLHLMRTVRESALNTPDLDPRRRSHPAFEGDDRLRQPPGTSPFSDLLRVISASGV